MCWIIVAVIILCVTLFLVWASADIGSNIYLKTLCQGDKNGKVVTLTFDDGPDEKMTPLVLDILKNYGIKATFFLVGNKVEQYPEIVRRIMAEGHVVANHTYSHSGLFPLSKTAAVEKELDRCDDAILSVTGKKTKLFRPPFGVTNPVIGKAVRRAGYHAIGWSVRSFDTKKNKDRETVCTRIIRRLHNGAVILLHDRCEKSDELLQMLVVAIMERGYKFVSAEEMLKIKAYEN